MQRDKVVLVDHMDNPIREMEKLAAHQQGVLHRAFSVFLFNSRGEMLIHQRAFDKYHGAGLWTNACCSHPQWDEDIQASATERLAFEMGLQCAIEKAFSFVYQAPVENDLIEHEYDHVFIGVTDATPCPNADEVCDFRWISVDTLLQEIKLHPRRFTYWFKDAVGRVIDEMNVKSN